MLKKLFVLLLVFNFTLSRAQTIKTDVLVIGGGASGVAAAVQCAHSKVKTVLAATSIQIGGAGKKSEMLTVSANSAIPSGLWGEFRSQIHRFYKNAKGYDTAYNAPLQFEAAVGDSVLKQMTDTVKNLSVYLKTSISLIKKDGDRWKVDILQNGKTITIKPRVIIDATEKGDIAVKAGAKFTTGFDIFKNSSASNSYRTSIAAGGPLPTQQNNPTLNDYPPAPYWFIPVNALLIKDEDNLLVLAKALPAGNDIHYLPMELEAGQGAGTIAAFCAFFKTTTQSLNVRTIQGELLDFKGYLLPFTDIDQKDPAWRAVQQICATGMLRGGQLNGKNEAQFVFMPDAPVTTAEVKPVLTEIYTRAFLWLRRETPAEKFTVGNLLSFISDYTLTEPVLLNKTVRSAWKTQYKFKTDFDLNRPITRREFAVLANKYLNPFARTVDLSGRLVN